MPEPEQTETVLPKTIEKRSLFKSLLKEPLTWYTGSFVMGAFFNFYCSRIDIPIQFRYTLQLVLLEASHIYNVMFPEKYKSNKFIKETLNTVVSFGAGMASYDITIWFFNWFNFIRSGGIQIQQIQPTPTPMRKIEI